jgi:hypothetical protein
VAAAEAEKVAEVIAAGGSDGGSVGGASNVLTVEPSQHDVVLRASTRSVVRARPVLAQCCHVLMRHVSDGRVRVVEENRQGNVTVSIPAVHVYHVICAV